MRALATDLGTWAALGGAALVGGGLSLVALWVHRRLWGFLPEDKPGGTRKLHARITPQVGFLLSAVAAVWLLLQQEPALAGALAGLAAVGYFDDRDKRTTGGIGWRGKAVVQFAAAALIAGSTTPRADPWVWLAVVAFAFVVINAVNFLDNMDGVAASLGGLGVLLATGGDGSLALAGALFLGFLPCNWPRPHLFLGDGGALPLGALLAAATLRAHAAQDGGVAFWPLVAPCVVPLADFLQVVSARLWLGYAPWVGDRRHLTHIATYVGVPARAVAPLLLGTAVLGWAALR